MKSTASKFSDFLLFVNITAPSVKKQTVRLCYKECFLGDSLKEFAVSDLQAEGFLELFGR